MSIDTKDKIDIRRLVIEEPRTETVPPPLNLITDADWPKIYEDLKEERDNGSPEFIYRAYELDVMFPGKLNDFKSSLSSEIDEHIERFLESGTYETQIIHVLELAKRMFPQKFDDIVKETEIKNLEWAFRDNINQPSPTTPKMQETASYYALFPDSKFSFNKESLLGPDPWETPGADLKREASRLASTRIILGDKLDKPVISSKFLETHMKFLLEQKQGKYIDWSRIIEHLYYLSVCAAKEIKFTDRGLELVMEPPKSPLDANIPTLPEVKKYGN